MNRTPIPDFDPIPLRYRRDGFTPERQRGLIVALARSGSLGEACREVGLSLESAYRLYRHPAAASFRRAWDAALAGARAAVANPPATASRTVSTSSTFSTSAPQDRVRIVSVERNGSAVARTTWVRDRRARLAGEGSPVLKPPT
jgi:hypothetical protein